MCSSSSSSSSSHFPPRPLTQQRKRRQRRAQLRIVKQVQPLGCRSPHVRQVARSAQNREAPGYRKVHCNPLQPF